jgi:site-specific DNA-methyltransferase (adenine-specific)
MTLINGDCLEVLKSYNSGSFDLIVCSPPYNIGVDYNGSHDDQMHPGDYIAWLRSVFFECHRVTSDDASFFLVLGGRCSDPLWPFEIVRNVTDVWTCQNLITWVKSISIDDEPVRGHVKPVNSSRYLNNCHEFVFHLTKRADVSLDKLAIGVPFADKSNLTRGDRGKHGDLRDRGNTWFIPYKTINSRATDRPHPTTFPVELASRCIKLHGVAKKPHVLDPFSGLGSTVCAATELGLHATGIEIDKEFHEEAVRRANARF